MRLYSLLIDSFCSLQMTVPWSVTLASNNATTSATKSTAASPTNATSSLRWHERTFPCDRVLVCAPSNAALDSLVLRLLKLFPTSTTTSGATTSSTTSTTTASALRTASTLSSQSGALGSQIVRLGPKSSAHPDVASVGFDFLVEREVQRRVDGRE